MTSKKLSPTLWYRSVITFKSFGKVYTTVFCGAWDSTKNARIPTNQIPAWVKRITGSMIACKASISEDKLKVKSFERGTQIIPHQNKGFRSKTSRGRQSVLQSLFDDLTTSLTTDKK